MQDRSEIWVHETGLPHACQGSLSEDLGDRILIVTDGSSASRRVEARAIDLAADAAATLLVLAIGDDADASTVATHARSRGVEVEWHVGRGDPVEVVLDRAPSLGATGILVGADQWQGQLSDSCLCAPLIRHAAVPVLVMHGSATADWFS